MRKIVSKPELFSGQPHIEGTSLTVSSLLAMLTRIHNLQSVLEIYPEITLEELKGALTFASEIVDESKWYLSGHKEDKTY